MNENSPAASPDDAEVTEATAPEVPLFQTPGADTPETDKADDDFTNPPILRDIRPSFWDFRNESDY